MIGDNFKESFRIHSRGINNVFGQISSHYFDSCSIFAVILCSPQPSIVATLGIAGSCDTQWASIITKGAVECIVSDADVDKSAMYDVFSSSSLGLLTSWSQSVELRPPAFRLRELLLANKALYVHSARPSNVIEWSSV